MHTFKIVILLTTFLVKTIYSATTLFGGSQASFFPSNAPSACLAAFNASLDCDLSVQLLNTQTEWVGWNQSNLTALCTSECYNALFNLDSTAASACGSYSPAFNGATLNASQILSFYLYKFNRTCLKGENDFCLIEEQTWDIGTLVSQGNATWPKHTNKTYPDWNCKTTTTFLSHNFAE